MFWGIALGILAALISAIWGNMGWGISIVIGIIVSLIVFYIKRRKNNEV